MNVPRKYYLHNMFCRSGHLGLIFMQEDTNDIGILLFGTSERLFCRDRLFTFGVNGRIMDQTCLLVRNTVFTSCFTFVSKPFKCFCDIIKHTVAVAKVCKLVN